MTNVTFDIFHGNALDWLKGLEESSVDSLVCDPPCGIAFMGKEWDDQTEYVPMNEKTKDAKGALELLGFEDWETGFVCFLADIMIEAIRVMKPGAHGLVWAIPRTSDLARLSLRLAGFEVRDRLAHIFGTGMPKNKKLEEDQSVGTALKPSVEDWWWVTKPKSFKAVPNGVEWDIATSLLEAYLWSISPAKFAQSASALKRAGSSEEFVSVRWIAAALHGFLKDQKGATDTFRSPEAASTFLSIVLLWKEVLGVLSGQKNTSITKTETDQTTALRTLNCFLLAITPESITKVAKNQNGLWSTVTDARKASKDSGLLWHHIPRPSAQDHASRNSSESVLEAVAEIAASLFGIPHAEVVSSARESATLLQDPRQLCNSVEDWWLIRKPVNGTITSTYKEFGTGGLNIKGCLVECNGDESRKSREGEESQGKRYTDEGGTNFAMKPGPRGGGEDGRWPPHLLLSHAPLCDELGCCLTCPIRILDEQSGTTKSAVSLGKGAYPGKGVTGFLRGSSGPHNQRSDEGGASRFYPRFLYASKPSLAEKEAGLEDLPLRSAKKWNAGGIQGRRDEQAKKEIAEAEVHSQGLDARGRTLVREDGTKTLVARFVAQHRANVHPTVKNIDLMRWLIRLITPPGGTVIDPFTGSGTTGCAALLEGCSFRGSELDQENEGFIEIATKRMEFWIEFAGQGKETKDILKIKKVEDKIEDSGQATLF